MAGATDKASDAGKAAGTALRDRAIAALRSAGVSQEGINFLISLGPDQWQNVVDDPRVPASFAQRFPTETAQAYNQAATEYGLEGWSDGTGGGPEGAAFAAAGDFNKGYMENPNTGAFKLDNGVIVDPNRGLDGVFMPPADPNVAGSNAWLEKVQDTWGEEKVNKWRQTLRSWGVDIAAKGGFDHTFLEALSMYHKYRYLNRGKVIPLDSAEGGVTRRDFDGALDPTLLRDEVETWASTIGMDLHEDDLNYLADKVARKAMSIANKKGYSPGNAARVAQAKVRNEFEDRPDVSEKVESIDDWQMRSGLYDTYVSVAQIVGQ